jgi:hypothetical protein
MLFFLPILPFVPLYLLFRRGGGDFRCAVLLAAVAWGLALTAVTEILSLWRGLDTAGLAVAWLLVAAACAAPRALDRRRAPRTPVAPPRARPPAASRSPRSRRRPLKSEDLLFLLPLGALALMAGLTALIAPPNNYDSMTYHMARVMHWLQHGTVAHYPTHLMRQLHQGPWAEFAIANLMGLAGSDRVANLVQWFALAGTGLGVSLIAQQLGAKRRGQLLAAALACSLPMGILQASTTQNDLVESFWLVCFTSILLALRTAAGRALFLYAAAAGGALGLAVLTKGTGYVFGAPLALWLGLSLLGRLRARALAPLALAALVGLAVNAGHYGRNTELYGTPIGPGGEEDGQYRYANAVFGPRVLVSNILRNAVLEIAVPIRAADRIEEGAVRAIHRWIGADPDDPRTTFTDEKFAVRGMFWHSENMAASPLHSILWIAFLIALPRLRWPDRRPVSFFAAALVGGFLLFSFYLRWQPWHCRLLLPLLALAQAPIALLLEREVKPRAAIAVALALLVLAVPPIVWSLGRPMTGKASIFDTSRTALYFTSAPGAGSVYQRLAAGVAARKANDIGFVMGVNDYEYPLWVLLRQRNPRARIEHVEVANVSARRAALAPWAAFAPAVILRIDGRTGQADIVDVPRPPAP